jgi:hypothetical protein
MAAPRICIAALGVTRVVSAALIGVVTRIQNRYFPLRPGTGFHYVGTRDGVRQTDDMVVTHGVKVVLGVRCTVVRDTVSERGEPVERTFDRYAQDKHGNV